MSDEKIIFKAHSLKQERAVFTEKRILALCSGTQYGKTTVGALRMKMRIHQRPGKDDNYIITAPTYKILNQSTLPPFLKFMEGYGHHHKQDAMFVCHSGAKVFFRTETDPDSIVGITNVRHVWCDEAGMYRLYFWQNVQARADFCGCGIDITTSPYAMNWVYKDLIKPQKMGKRPDVELIQAASWENPYHYLSDETARRFKMTTMDKRRFDMIYGGDWGKMAGLVYDCFDDESNQIEAFELPTGTRFVAGVDWGYTDPFVLKVRAITPDGRHYGVSEFYKTGMVISDMIQIAKQKKEVFGISQFYCDPSQPGLIEEFCRNGLPAVGSENDIMRGVHLHYELLKTRRLKYFKDSHPYTLDEYEAYHYPNEDELGPDDNSKELKPVGQGDHAMDADRYITLMTYRSGTKLAPKVVDEGPKQLTQVQKIARLKRRPGGARGSEDWS